MYTTSPVEDTVTGSAGGTERGACDGAELLGHGTLAFGAGRPRGAPHSPGRKSCPKARHRQGVAGLGGIGEAVGPRELRTGLGMEDALKGGRRLGVSGGGGGATVVRSEGPQCRSQHSRRTWKLWQYGTGPGWSRLRHTSPKLTLHCTTCPTPARLAAGARSERHSMSLGCSQKTWPAKRRTSKVSKSPPLGPGVG